MAKNSGSTRSSGGSQSTSYARGFITGNDIHADDIKEREMQDSLASLAGSHQGRVENRNVIAFSFPGEHARAIKISITTENITVNDQWSSFVKYKVDVISTTSISSIPNGRQFAEIIDTVDGKMYEDLGEAYRAAMKAVKRANRISK